MLGQGLQVVCFGGPWGLNPPTLKRRSAGKYPSLQRSLSKREARCFNFVAPNDGRRDRAMIQDEHICVQRGGSPLNHLETIRDYFRCAS
jgi:hypothetical protein